MHATAQRSTTANPCDAATYYSPGHGVAAFLGQPLCHAVPFEPCAVGLNCFTLVTVCFNRDFSKPLMPPNNACLLLSILSISRHCRERSLPHHANANCHNWNRTSQNIYATQHDSLLLAREKDKDGGQGACEDPTTKRWDKKLCHSLTLTKPQGCQAYVPLRKVCGCKQR